MPYICNRLAGEKFLKKLESCLSGRKDMFAKHAYGKLYQGFESLTLRLVFSGCSVARLSRLLWEQEAAGSNPATPTKSRTAMFGFFCNDNLMHMYVVYIRNSNIHTFLLREFYIISRFRFHTT